MRPKKKAKDKLKPICVKLSPETMKALKVKSKLTGESVSTLIRMSLNRFMEQKDWIV